jgi:hypothetical protein
MDVERVEEASVPADAAPARAPLQTAPWPDADPLAADLLVMIQRLDDRLAGAEQALAALGERADRLERRSGIEAEELAWQRAALARLDLALGRPLGRPDPTRAPEPSPPPRPPRSS